MIEPDSTTPVIVLIALLFLHAFFSTVREAIANTRKSRRIQFMEEEKLSAEVVDHLAENPTLLLTTEQVATKFSGAFIVIIAVLTYSQVVVQYMPVSEFTAAVLVTLIAAGVILFFGELIPKEIGRRYAEAISFSLVGPFNVLAFIVRPFAQLITRIGRLLTGHWNDTQEDVLNSITEEDLRSYVDAGEEEGVLKEEEKEMIYSIFNLGDTSAREVMVPRVDIVAVEADASVTSAMDVIMQAGHSRVPVYQGTIDNIIGILYVKDLLTHWLKEGEPPSVRGLERGVYYVPENKPVIDLLRELQTKKVHIAIVVDEYGGTAGLVTIEDILEEIVGEIQDEHDADEFYMQYISDDEYIFSARMDLDDINDVMSINLPTEESDTLGGLIYDALGRIPSEGETLDGVSFGVPHVYLTVLDVEGRRIKTARVKRIREEESQALESSEASAGSSSSSPLVSNAHNTVS